MKLYIPTGKLRTLFPMSGRRFQGDTPTPFDAWIAACIYTWRSPFLTPEAVFQALGRLESLKKHRHKQRGVEQIAGSLRVLKKRGLIEAATLSKKTGQFRIVAHFPDRTKEFYTALNSEAARLPAREQIVYLCIKATRLPVLHWKQIASYFSPRPHAPKKTVLSAFEQLVESGFLHGHVEDSYIVLHPLKEKFSKT